MKYLTLPRPSPAMALMFEIAEKRGEEARTLAKKIAAKYDHDTTLGLLHQHLLDGTIERVELMGLLNLDLVDLAEIVALNGKRRSDFWHVGPDWRIVGHADHGDLVVQRGDMKCLVHITPRDEDICPHCRNYSPWSGNLCCSCGVRNCD